MSVGPTIKDLRIRKQMKQLELSAKRGVSQNYLSQIEHGKQPKFATLQRLSKALEVPPEVITFLSMDYKDIPDNKKEAYRHIEPTIKAMITEFFIHDKINSTP